ncbi:MAG: hypothetical protein IT374_03430 [Polyangiaceae bacterium]|nr:hypothetical protein [Polyangiaceae bacterium]
MAIYTTFFLCTDELLGGSPGWRPPLASPSRREFRNPFTGEVSVVETVEPEWPDGGDEGDEPGPEYGAVEVQGSYEGYLGGRIPAFVRSRVHWAAKGLTEVELGPLCEIVGVRPEFVSPIYGPPSSGAEVQQLPAGLLAKLAVVDLKTVAKQWAAAMSTPEHTHAVSGVQVSDAWSTLEASAVLEPLVALARQATAGQQLYVLVET